MRHIASHAVGGVSIRGLRTAMRSSIQEWVWRIFPSADVDERPPERLFFSTPLAHALPRSIGLRGTPLGDTA